MNFSNPRFLILFFVFLVALTSFVYADIVSINSGGGDELVITSGEHIEGFFSCVPGTCSSLGYTCGTWSNECGETITCGTCDSGFTCTAGTCVAIPSSGGETTTSTTTSSSGGGRGGVASTVSQTSLSVVPSELSVSVIEGVEESRELTITNTGTTSLSVNAEVSGEDIEDVITIIGGDFFLVSNQVKILELIIMTESKNLLTGKILVKFSGRTKEVFVTIDTRSENFLFDISIFLNDKFKKIFVGEKIEAQFNLIEVGTNEKVDVIANYIIKDFEGNSHYEESETFFVLGEKNYMKEFPTQNLQEGKYVLGFEISYPGAFAVSSTTFSIEEKTKFNYKIILILISSLIFILIIILVVIKKQNRNLHIFKGKKKKIRRKK